MNTPPKQITDKEWRPDLTGYEIYAEMLLDTMADGLNKMSVTDVPKILIEQAIGKKFPAIKIKKRRKVYEKLDY
jgi:hypothetical protein